MSVQANLEAVRERIARTGRDPSAVTIVAVTKGFGVDRCREALAAGLTVLGENRVQEALSKMDEVDGAQWHLIGHLQTNKVRHAANRFALIQSVDSIRLAEHIAAIDPKQPILVEVNTAREPQKSGVAPEVAVEAIRQMASLLPVLGLMTIGPVQGDPSPSFNELGRLCEEVRQSLGQPLPVLSMGMSGDFEAALAAGSTMLRLGKVLFGPRPA